MKDQWGKEIPNKRLTRKEAIHKFCRECNGTQVFLDENDCTDPSCYLFSYRPGKGAGTVKTQTSRKITPSLLKRKASEDEKADSEDSPFQH